MFFHESLINNRLVSIRRSVVACIGRSVLQWVLVKVPICPGVNCDRRMMSRAAVTCARAPYLLLGVDGELRVAEVG